MTPEERVRRDNAIVRARFVGATEAEVAARYDLRRSHVSAICERARARCQGSTCRPPVHEPQCPLADPVELALSAEPMPPISEGGGK